ncbi:hypothetical protein B4Q13_18715, partial [Lacticaseibacillus rhamnosus]
RPRRGLRPRPPESVADDRASGAIVRTQTPWLRGDSALARAYADSARLANLEILKVAPRDAQRLIFLGLSYAFLGQRQETAIEAALRELREETGYTARRIEEVSTGPISAGMTTERVTFFLAQHLLPGKTEQSRAASLL